jgi:glycosyltransferase involved in cell wall biosynthesis
MRIAVNAGSFTSHQGDNNQYLFTKILLPLAYAQPDSTFIFFFDTPPSEKFKFPGNAIIAVFGPEVNTPVKNRIWYRLKIPLALKKHKVDVFVTINYCSVKTKIPQILVSPDLGFIYETVFVNQKHLSFYRKYTPLFLEKSSILVVQSLFSKNQLVDRYKIIGQKISVFPVEPDNDFIPLEFEEKNLIKEKYAEGNEYFIYQGFIGQQWNLMNLIKAFSAFKKRQKSKMQLIITGTPGVGFEEFSASLKGYRFRSELKILTDLTGQEIAKITASAYAMVYLPLFETSSAAPCEAMKCGVPVIVSSTGALPEICGEAALYANPTDFRNIAENIMLIFKDEKRRKELIEKGRAQTEQFSVNKDLDSFFQLVKNTAAH